MGKLVKELVIFSDMPNMHTYSSLTFAFVSLFIKAPYLKKRDIHIKVIFEERERCRKDVENSTEKRRRIKRE